MTCSECNGTGRVGYRTPEGLEDVPLGNGVVMRDMGGWSTRACGCVRNLPAVDGEATWWEVESIFERVVNPDITGMAPVEISADCEVPRSEDGRRVHRTSENSYWPPMVETQGPEKLRMLPDDARALAEALIAAADACDEADSLAKETA